MTNLLFILLFPSIPNSVIYPVAAIPLVLAVINWILIMSRRKSEGVAGVICAGSKYVKYLFYAYIAVIACVKSRRIVLQVGIINRFGNIACCVRRSCILRRRPGQI